jgi:hypothetical protein
MSSTGGRIRRFVREHQVFSGIVGAVIAAVVAAGVSLTIWLAPGQAGETRARADLDVPAGIDRCTTVKGMASIPEGVGLWLFVKTPTGMFTPLQPITVDGDGRWTMTRTGIGDDQEAGQEFVFHVIALPQPWAQYLAEIDKRDPLPTVAVLPPGAEVLATARTWRDGDQTRCP